MKKEQICKNCRYYKEINVNYDGSSSEGECRKYVPKVFIYEMKEKYETERVGGIENKIKIETLFPQVYGKSFCGQFKTNKGGEIKR